MLKSKKVVDQKLNHEDLEGCAEMMSEDVEWRNCFYGAPIMDKEAAIKYITWLH